MATGNQVPSPPWTRAPTSTRQGSLVSAEESGGQEAIEEVIEEVIEGVIEAVIEAVIEEGVRKVMRVSTRCICLQYILADAEQYK